MLGQVISGDVYWVSLRMIISFRSDFLSIVRLSQVVSA